MSHSTNPDGQDSPYNGSSNERHIPVTYGQDLTEESGSEVSSPSSDDESSNSITTSNKPCISNTDKESFSDNTESNSAAIRNANSLSSRVHAEKMEKLNFLKDILCIEDLSHLYSLLEQNNWNLQAAVIAQLEMASNMSNQSPQQEIPPSAQLPDLEEVHNSHPVHRDEGWLGFTVTWSLYLLQMIFRHIYYLFFLLLGFMMPQDHDPETNIVRPQVRAAESRGDNRSFKEVFEARFGSNHPPIYTGTYNQVLYDGKKDLKIVLAYLHSPDHEDTDFFCQDLLTSDFFCKFVNDNDILFWGCLAGSTDSEYLAPQTHDNDDYDDDENFPSPFLAVIVLQQNRMRRVGTVEGSLMMEEAMRELQTIVNSTNSYLLRRKAEKAEIEWNRQIRMEQDAAFEEAFRQDKENEKKKQEELEAKRKEEEERLRLQREEEQRKERIKHLKIDLASKVAEEPNLEAPGTIEISIRLPGGERLTRRFLRSQTLQALHLFVFCHPKSPDEFDLYTSHPKKVIQCRPTDEPMTFEEAGLIKSTALHLDDLEDYEFQ